MEEIFNKNLLKIHRDKSAQNFANHNFLVVESFSSMLEKINELGISPKNILDIGSKAGYDMYQKFYDLYPNSSIYQTDISLDSLIHQSHPKNYKINCDAEFLPFANQKFDLIISNLYLHNYNDITKILSSIRNFLTKDGAVLLSIFGAKTLIELKESYIISRNDNNIYPIISPFIHIKDLAMLAKYTGFVEPVAESEILQVHYDNIFDIYKDLKYMGENNKLIKQRHGLTTKKSLLKIEDAYREKFSYNKELIVSFEIITLTSF